MADCEYECELYARFANWNWTVELVLKKYTAIYKLFELCSVRRNSIIRLCWRRCNWRRRRDDATAHAQHSKQHIHD